MRHRSFTKSLALERCGRDLTLRCRDCPLCMRRHRIIFTDIQVLATYHVAATTVLIVDSVAWLVLMPMLSQQHPSPDAAWRKLFFCWTGYNQVFASVAPAALWARAGLCAVMISRVLRLQLMYIVNTG